MDNRVFVEKALGDFRRIPLPLIRSGGSREVFEDISSLASTVKRHGLLSPIIVRKSEKGNFYVVICGERRFRACKEAGLETIPAIVVGEVSEEQTLEMQVVENVQRSNLKAFEEIRLVKMLKDRFNLSNEEIGIKCGLSHKTVAKYLTIANSLPEEYIKLIEHKTHRPTDLTIDKAFILSRANLPADKLKFYVDLITKKGLTKRQLTAKLATSEKRSKIKRVYQGKLFWKELVRSLKSFHKYWREYSEIREWETVDSFHLTLTVSLPKDLGEGEPS